MHIDDATSFLVDLMRKPRGSGGYSTYGYEVFVPVVVYNYMKEIERPTSHDSTWIDSPRGRELSTFFYEAAWELCRRGILRPSPKMMGSYQNTGDGNGYTVTEFGRGWLAQDAPSSMVVEPGRLGELFGSLSKQLGDGFLQRANEAVLCYKLSVYLACCAMCGAAAESILLAVATAKNGNEQQVLATYRAAHGRRKIIDGVVGQSRPAISEPFRSAAGLLSYWRDDAAHGLASNISEIEAHEALARLLRFAQFVNDNWGELVT